jgi:hypothetical protein
MQNLLVHVACHPRRKHVMYVRGKINLSERESRIISPARTTGPACCFSCSACRWHSSASRRRQSPASRTAATPTPARQSTAATRGGRPH